IENNATAVLDARYRTDVATVGGVVLNARTVINPGGTLQLAQSSTAGTDTGFHTLSGNTRGLGGDSGDARFAVQLGTKTTTTGPVGGVNWPASAAQFEVLGTGNNGLRVEGSS